MASMHAKLKRTVTTAMRMLDNVIDINFYTIPEARRSNLRHRPVGLGLMGFQDALQALRIPIASDAAVAFADRSMEAIAFHAISASVDLAAERGRYPTFDGSLWSQGILPHRFGRTAGRRARRPRRRSLRNARLATARASASRRPACATPT